MPPFGTAGWGLRRVRDRVAWTSTVTGPAGGRAPARAPASPAARSTGVRRFLAVTSPRPLPGRPIVEVVVNASAVWAHRFNALSRLLPLPAPPPAPVHPDEPPPWWPWP